MKNVFLGLFILYSINTLGQLKLNLIPGSEKPQFYKCAGTSCIIDFKSYTVLTKDLDEEVGQEITIIPRNGSGHRVSLSSFVGDCNFYGIYKNFILADCGTYVIRGYEVYDIQKNTYYEIPLDFYGRLSRIINDKLVAFADVLEDEVKKLKLKRGACLTQDCGFYEEVVYDFPTQKLYRTGKFKWIE